MQMASFTLMKFPGNALLELSYIYIKPSISHFHGLTGSGINTLKLKNARKDGFGSAKRI